MTEPIIYVAGPLFDEVVNLMIEHSVELIVRSLDELDGELRTRFGQPSGTG